MELSIQSNGERCQNESHRFRIGVDSTAATEFEASQSQFLERLTNALLDHGMAKRAAGNSLYLQVWCGRDWRNVQNPKTGGVMAVTHQIVGQPETAATLFLWACNSVQMMRDIDVLADGLSREASE